MNFKRIILGLGLFLQAQFSFGQTANSLSFDGTNDLVNLGTDSAFAMGDPAITLEAWIFATAWKTWVYEGGILVKEENTYNLGYMLRAGEGGKLNFAVGNGTWNELTTKAGTLSLNTWTHIAGTYDGKYSRLYVNGKIVDSAAFNTTIGQSYSTPLVVGNHSGTYSRYWQGNIDEVRVWNIVRSSAEIANNYQKEFCEFHKGLIGYYKFNQGKASSSNSSEKILLDYSGFKRNGTLQGFALSGTTSNWVSGIKLKKASTNDSFSVTRCDRYTVPSKARILRKSGIFLDTIPTWLGCDSALKINLTILPNKAITRNLWICDSIAIPGGGGFYKKSGTYIDNLKTFQGCDSAVTTVLKVGADTGFIKATQCYFWKSPSGRHTYTTSGIYKDTIKNIIGCDSVITLNVTILKSTYSKITLKSCYKSVKSPSGKYSYSIPGTYYDTLVNKAGCDSIIEVKYDYSRTFSTVNLNGCRRILSPSGKKYYTQSGTFLDTLMNRAFCDSIVTVNVKIIPSSSKVVSLSGCRSVLSPLKNREFKYSGKYTDTLVNYLGCDSVITWDVTVNQVNTDISLNNDTKTYTATASSASYQWLDCKNAYQKVDGATQKTFKPELNGYYGVEVTQLGCTDTSFCLIVSGVSVSSVNGSPSFLIYPQPARDNVSISSVRSLAGAEIQLISSTGQWLKVVSKELLNQDFDCKLNLEVEPGIYFLKVKYLTGEVVSQSVIITD